LGVPKFLYNTVMYDIPRVTYTPQTSSICSTVSTEHRLVTYIQIEGYRAGHSIALSR